MERLAIAIEPIVASMLGDRNKLLRR